MDHEREAGLGFPLQIAVNKVVRPVADALGETVTSGVPVNE
jgi:hypothetical protein